MHNALKNELDPKDKEEKRINRMKQKIQRGKKIQATQDNIKLLVLGLGDQNGLIRRSFAEELGRIGKDALPELINALLNSKNVIQRRAAAKTLKLVGDPKALPSLIKALINDEDQVVQCSAAGAIAIFGETAVNHLIIILKNPLCSEMQYGLASWCLAFIGAEAPNALKKAAISKNSNIRSAAISALEEQIRTSQDLEALALLNNALNDNSENVQIEAIKLVGKLNKIESLIPILIYKLKSLSPEIRKNSVISLMLLNSQEALTPLRELIKIEKEESVKKITTLAIKKIILSNQLKD